MIKYDSGFHKLMRGASGRKGFSFAFSSAHPPSNTIKNFDLQVTIFLVMPFELWPSVPKSATKCSRSKYVRVSSSRLSQERRARAQRTAHEGKEAHEDWDVGAVRVEGDQLAPPPAHAVLHPQSALARAHSAPIRGPRLAARPAQAYIAALNRRVLVHVHGSRAPRCRGKILWLWLLCWCFDRDGRQRSVQAPVLVGRFAHLRKEHIRDF